MCHCKLTAPASELSEIDCGLSLTTLNLIVCDCKLTSPASEPSDIDCELSRTTLKLNACYWKLIAPPVSSVTSFVSLV